MKFHIFVWLFVVIVAVAYGQEQPQNFPIFSPEGIPIQDGLIPAFPPAEGDAPAEDQPIEAPASKAKSPKRTKTKVPKLPKAPAATTTVKPKKEKEERKSKRPTKAPAAPIPVTMKAKKHSKTPKVPVTTAAPVQVAKLKAVRKHLARRTRHHKKN